MTRPLRSLPLLVAVALLGTGCLVQKNPLQDVDAGNTESVRATGGAAGLIRVLDKNMNPVATGFGDVKVILTNTTTDTSTGGNNGPNLVQAYTTAPDNSGHWSIYGIPLGQYSIEVDKPGFGPQTTTAQVSANGITPVPDITLTSTGVTISGCARVPQPGPATGNLQLSLRQGPDGETLYGGPTSFTPSPCKDGQTGFPYTFSGVAPGKFKVTITSQGFTGETPVIDVADSDVDLGILVGSRATFQVQGSVHDNVTGEEAANNHLGGITVTITDTSTTPPTVAATTITDASGNFQVDAMVSTNANATYALNLASAVFMLTPAAPAGGTSDGGTSDGGTSDGGTGAPPATNTFTQQDATMPLPPIGVQLRTYNVTGCVVVPPPAPDSTGVLVSVTGLQSGDGTTLTLPAPNSPGGPIFDSATDVCTPAVQALNAAGVNAVNSVGNKVELSGIKAGKYQLTLRRSGFETVTIPLVVPAFDAMDTPTDVTLPDVMMNRAYFNFQGNACAKATPQNLLTKLGDGNSPTPNNAAVTLSGGSLNGVVLNGAVQTVSVGLNNCGDMKTIQYNITNVPQPLNSTDVYTLTISKRGYQNYTARLSCSADMNIPGSTYCDPSAAIKAPTDAKLLLLDNTIQGCIIPASPGPGPQGLSVTLNGTAFDLFQLPTAGLPATPTPDCSALGLTGVKGYAFGFTGVPNGHYWVNISSPGFESAQVTINDLDNVTSATTETIPTLQLAREMGIYQGTVAVASPVGGVTVDPSNAAGATVLLIGEDTIGAVPQTLTKQDGSYEFDNVPVSTMMGAPYILRASKLGFVSSGDQNIPLVYGMPTPVPQITLTLQTSDVSGCITIPPSGSSTATNPTATLSGTISVLNGTPAYGPMTQPATPSAACGANGYAYTFSKVPFGTYSIGVAATGYDNLTIPAVQVTGSPVVSVPPRALSRTTMPVSGMVNFLAGNTTIIPKVSGAIVTLSGGELLNVPYEAVTDTIGSYTFGAVPVSPSGTAYTLTASAPNYTATPLSAPVTVSPSGVSGTTSLSLTVTASTLAGCVAVPPPGPDSSGVSATITGSAFDGSPLPGGMTVPAGTASSCPTGSYAYTFPNIPNGTYQVTFQTNGFDPVTVSNVVVNATSQGTTIQVPPAQFTRSHGQVQGSVSVSDPSGTGIQPKLNGVNIALTGTDQLGVTLRTSIPSPMGLNGTYTFTDVPVNTGTNQYTVTASAVGYVAKTTGSDSAQVPAVTANQTAIAPGLQLAVAASTVNGCVLLPAPVTSSAGVTVVLTGQAFDGTSITLPNPNAVPVKQILSAGACSGGSANASAYSIPNVPNGTYTVTLTHTGFEPVSFQNVVVASANVSLPLATMNVSVGSVTGTVSTTTTNPLGLTLTTAGAVVMLTGTTPQGQTYQSQVTLGSGGTYTFNNVPVTASGPSYTITVTSPGYTASASPNVNVAAAQTTTVPNIVISPVTATVSGCVLVPAPATDSSGVNVVMTGVPQINPAGMLTFPTSGTVTTSATTACSSGQPGGGSFSFNGVPNGTYNIAFNLAGFAPANVAIVVSGNNVIAPTVTMGRQTGTVTGTVSLSNNGTGVTPDANGNMLVTLSSTTTDLLSTPYQTTAVASVPGGPATYTFLGVPVSTTSAPYSLTFAKANYTTPATPITVTVLPSQVNTASSSLTLSMVANTISGCVLIPPGTGAGGVNVVLSGTAFDGSPFPPTGRSTSTTAGSGACATGLSYSFSSIPNGIYSIQFTSTGLNPLTLSGINLNYGTSGNTLQAPLGSMTQLLAIVKGSVTVSNNSTGLPVNTNALTPGGATVALSGPDLAGQVLQTVTAASGQFSFPSVPYNSTGNNYTLTITKTGYTPSITSLTSITSSSVSSGTFTVMPSPNLAANANMISGCVANPTGVVTPPTVTATLAGTAFTNASYPVAGTQSMNPSTVTAVLGNCAGDQTALGYQFNNVPDGSYSIQINAAGYNSIVVGTFVVAGLPVVLPPQALRRATATLFGTIGVQDSNPATNITQLSTDVAGVTVTMTGADQTVVNYTASTDTSGYWSMTGVPVPVSSTNTYGITASKYGYVSPIVTQTPPVTAGSNLQVNVPKLTVDSHTVSGCAILGGTATDSTGVTATLGGTGFNGTQYPASTPYVVTVQTTTNSSKCGTGSTGRVYQFLNVPDGSYTVTIKSTGYSTATLPVVVSGNDIPSSQNLTTLSVVPVTGSLSGTITVSASSTAIDLTAADAAGIQVNVYEPMNLATPLATAVTDGGGNWSIPSIALASGTTTTFTVKASKSGYSTITTSAVVSPNANTQVTFSSSLNVIGSTVAFCAQLSPASMLSSNVSAVITGTAFNGTAFPWAGVSQLPKASVGGSACGSGMSSGTSFQFPSNIPNGTYTLTLSLAGYATVTTQPFTVNAVGSAITFTASTSQTVLPQATGTIIGTVVANDAGTGLAVSGAGAQVALSGTGVGSISPVFVQGNGTFEFDNVPVSATGSSYNITVTETNFSMLGSYAVIVPAGATVSAGTVIMRLTTGAATGIVKLPAPAPDSADVSATISGTAFTGATWSGGADAPSSSDGTINFSKVPPGTYTVTLNRSGYSSATASNVIIASGTTTAFSTSAMPITLSPITSMYPATVAGCAIVPAPGTGSAGINVKLSGTSFTGSPVTATQNINSGSPQACDGGQPGLKYSFAGVVGGTYQVQFGGNSAFVTYTVPNISVAPTTSGTTVYVPLVQLTRATGVLTGTLTASASGTGLTPDVGGAVISLSGADLVGQVLTYTVPTGSSAASTATYSFPAVPISPNGNAYTITVSKDNYAQTGTLPVTGTVSSAMSTTVNLTMAIATGTISGCALNGTNTNSDSIDVSLSGLAFNGQTYSPNDQLTSIASMPCPGGGLPYTFTNVPPGTYSETLVSPSGASLTVQGITVYPNTTFSVPLQSFSTGGSSTSGTWTASGQIQVADASMATGITLGSTSAGGVRIDLTGGCLSLPLYTYTDSSGNWSLSNIPVEPKGCSTGDFVVKASMFGVTTQQSGTFKVTKSGTNQSVPVCGAQPCVPTLTVVPYSLSGSVTVDIGGATFGMTANNGGVTATLSGTAFNGTAYTKTATSTSAGTYTFPPLPAGTYMVTLSVPATGSNTSSYQTVLATPGVFNLPGTTSLPSTFLPRATGTISGTVSLSANGTGLTFTAPSADFAGITISLSDAASDPSGWLGASYAITTDTNGSFTLTGVPAPKTPGATYTVNASKQNFTPSPASSPVGLVPNTVVNPSGALTLSVNPATVNVKAQLTDAIYNGGAITYSANTAVTLTGVAFNGSVVAASTKNTDGTTGIASFSTLPPGSYTVTAALPQHSSNGAVAVGAIPGVATTATITLSDTAAPSSPIITAKDQATGGTTLVSPISTTAAYISLVQKSVDPTLPTANFRDYVVQLCAGGTCTYQAPLDGQEDAGWDGSTPFQVTLTNGKENYILVSGRDSNGNLSPPATLSLQVETTKPNAPTNVHVDNRPGAARISWNAPASSGSTLPIAGYRVYYGPTLGSSASAFTGTFASEGPSPVNVTSGTEVTLTGLPNGEPFYVAVQAYDTASTPSVSPLTTAVRVEPNAIPLDRALHTNVLGSATAANSIAVFRDEFVTSVTTATGAYSLQAYQYNGYGTVTAVSGAQPSNRASVLVPDSNYIFYGFDPAATVSQQEGVDVFTYDATSSPPFTAVTNQLGGWVIDHLVPTHRSNIASASSTHGIVTYTSPSNGKHFLVTFNIDPTDHMSLNADSDQVELTNDQGAQPAAPYDVRSRGNFVFTLHDAFLDGYTIASDFTGITSQASGATPTAHVAIPNAPVAPQTMGSLGRAMVLNWPNVFFTCGTTNTAVCLTSVSSTSPLTLGSATQVLTTLGGVTKMLVSGDLLYLAERPLTGTTAIEVFNISSPNSPVRVGLYDLNQNSEIGQDTVVADLQLHRGNLFALLTATNPSTAAWVDVIEAGGPRSMVEGNAFALTSGTGLPLQPLGAVIQGSRAITYAMDSNSNTYLADVDLSSEFGAGTAAKTTVSAPSSATSTYDANVCGTGRPCLPMAVYGEYAFVATQTGTTGQIAAYDIGIPDAVNAGTPLFTINTPAPVTGLAVANDFLYATEDGASWLQRWNLDGFRSSFTPLSPSTGTIMNIPGSAYALDVWGDYVYVAGDKGFCQVWSDANTHLQGSTRVPDFQVMNCWTTVAPATGIAADSGNLFVAQGGSNASNIDVFSLSALPRPSQSATIAQALSLQTLASASTPAGMFLAPNGPNLFSSVFDSTTGLSGIAGFDFTNPVIAPPTKYLPVGDDYAIQKEPRGTFGLSGPFMVTSDAQRGLVLIHTY